MTKALENEGRNLAVYLLDGGPLGNLAPPEYLVKKLKNHRGIDVTVDEVMICSGSTQCILLINETLLEPGDVVITELYSYSGALNNAKKSGARVWASPWMTTE